MSYLWCGSSVWRLIRHRPAWTRGVWIHFVVIHLFLLFLVLVFSTTDGFCDQLSPPVNGTLDTTFTRFGTTVTFGCFPGFELEGAKKTQCVRSETHTSGFKWDSVPPLCTGNTLSVFVLLLYARALYITLRRFHSAIAYANRNCTGDRLMYPSNFIQRTRCSYYKTCFEVQCHSLYGTSETKVTDAVLRHTSDVSCTADFKYYSNG